MPTLQDNYPSENSGVGFVVRSGSVLAYGQTFVAIDGYIPTVAFYLSKVGSPTGDITARIYALTGTPGTNGKPTGSPLATSDAIDASILSTTARNIYFNFIGANLMDFAAGGYCVLVTYSGGDSSNYIRVGQDSTSETHDGNGFSSTNLSAWTSSTNYDIIFYVYQSDSPSRTYATSRTVASERTSV